MVYIKLCPALYQKVKNHISSNVLHCLNGIYFIPYTELKRVAAYYLQPLHELVQSKDILNNSTFQALVKDNESSPAEKESILRLKQRHDERIFGSASIKKNYYFQQKRDSSIKELTASMTFAMSFVFSFFMAGITGFYLGNYFLGYDFVSSLMLSLGFIAMTIIIETTLFILKQTKETGVKKKKYYTDRNHFKKKQD